jgi:hypothetical protein
LGQAAAGRQAPLPSQSPLNWEPTQLATQAPSAVPAATAAQVPRCPVTLQDVQSAQLALVQQMPSTQLPLAQSWLPPQAWPMARRHEPLAAQEKPGEQLASLVQEVSQIPATQA